MKKKICLLLVLEIIVLFMFSNTVNAVFTKSEAEDAIGDETTYLEIVGPNKEPIVQPIIIKRETDRSMGVSIPARFV